MANNKIKFPDVEHWPFVRWLLETQPSLVPQVPVVPVQSKCHCLTALARHRCRHASGIDGCDLETKSQNLKIIEMEYTTAKQLANQIVTTLTPFCSVIHIAGSIRRRSPEPNDIEIVCIPQKEVVKVDMFSSALAPVPQFKDAIKKLTYQRIKGMPEGNYMQFILSPSVRCQPEPVEGLSIGACHHAPEGQGIKVDLFMPREDDYYRILAIRTGSADYAHKVIAAAWLKKGWCGVAGEGLRLQKDCVKNASGSWILINKNCEKPPKWESEEAFFKWLNIPWLPPTERDYLPKHLAL